MGSLKLSKIFENSNKNLSEKLKEFSSFIENEEKTYRKRRDKYHESREGREHVRGGTFKLFLFFLREYFTDIRTGTTSTSEREREET